MGEGEGVPDFQPRSERSQRPQQPRPKLYFRAAIHSDVSPAAKAQAPMLARSQSPKAEAESRFNTEAHCPAAAPSISGIQSPLGYRP